MPFGYTRGDVMLIGVGVTAAGFAMYYGLQANGVSAVWAGNIVQLTFVLGLTVAWVGSYVQRRAVRHVRPASCSRHHPQPAPTTWNRIHLIPANLPPGLGLLDL